MKICSSFFFSTNGIHILGVVFSLFIGCFTVATYHALFIFILRNMPKSFTYGEASIVIQGLVIFLINFYLKLIVIAKKTTDCMKDTNSVSCVMYSNNFWTINHDHITEMVQLTTILQVNPVYSTHIKSTQEYNNFKFALDWFAWCSIPGWLQLFCSVLEGTGILRSFGNGCNSDCTISNR